MEEIDIWRTAKILVDAHGDGAEAQAAWRADKAREDGFADAVNIWKRIGNAIRDLSHTNPESTEPRH